MMIQNEIATSPRLSPNKQYILYLSKYKDTYINESSWMLKYYDLHTHVFCFYSYHLQQKTAVLLSLKEDPQEDEFPGLFCLELPKQPWSENNEYLYPTFYPCFFLYWCVQTSISTLSIEAA